MVKRMDRRKVLAVLAGGLVLGVGAAVTLASWNDDEVATGDFTAGEFVFQGSSDGTTFTDHATGDAPGELSFETGADTLSPGDVVYEAYALKLTGDYDADLAATAPAETGTIAEDLAYGAVATTAFGCDAAAFAGGSAVPTTIASGQTINLCLQVTAEDSIEQGDTGTVTWQWVAESK